MTHACVQNTVKRQTKCIQFFVLDIRVFHNSCLIRQIQQNKIYKNSETWPRIEPGSLAQQSGRLTITLE